MKKHDHYWALVRFYAPLRTTKRDARTAYTAWKSEYIKEGRIPEDCLLLPISALSGRFAHWTSSESGEMYTNPLPSRSF